MHGFARRLFPALNRWSLEAITYLFDTPLEQNWQQMLHADMRTCGHAEIVLHNQLFLDHLPTSNDKSLAEPDENRTHQGLFDLDNSSVRKM